MIGQRRTAATSFLASGLVIFSSVLGSAEAQTLVVTGATVIDPLAEAPLEDGVVVMTDGRITAVGAAGAVDVPAGTSVSTRAARTSFPG